MNNCTKSLKIKKLQWQCRRGMLEVDIHLMRYLAHQYPTKPAAEQAHFERLLQESDPVLLAWFTGKSLPDDPDMAALVKNIRQVCQQVSSDLLQSE